MDKQQPKATTEALAPLGALLPDLEALYKEIQEHPELSMQETRTAAERLGAAGFDMTTGSASTSWSRRRAPPSSPASPPRVVELRSAGRSLRDALRRRFLARSRAARHRACSVSWCEFPKGQIRPIAGRAVPETGRSGHRVTLRNGAPRMRTARHNRHGGHRPGATSGRRR